MTESCSLTGAPSQVRQPCSGDETVCLYIVSSQLTDTALILLTIGKCNTREVVLKRDGTDVVQGSDCSAQSGTWFSEYDGETWTSASDLQIDHLVPLKEAWVSGAASWSVV